MLMTDMTLATNYWLHSKLNMICPSRRTS